MDGVDELITRAASGDEDALADLLAQVTPELRGRIASRISQAYRGSIEADDILQVTFIEAFMRIDSFTSRDAGGLMAWLSRIAENNLRDAVRGLEAAKRPSPRQRVHAARSAEDSYDTLVVAIGGTLTTPSQAAAKGEAFRAIDDAIERLPPDYAAVVRELDLAGRPVEEVAGEMGRSKGAVYMLRARAHDALRDLMGPASKYISFT